MYEMTVIHVGNMKLRNVVECLQMQHIFNPNPSKMEGSPL